MLILKTKKREKKDSLKAIREDGFIPAVYYGRTQDSVSISIPLKDFEKMWRDAGESSVVTLEDENSKKLEALIHEIDLNPLTNRPRHVDFYVFEEGKTIEVSVPLEFVGVAPVVKNQGAMLVKVSHQVLIETMPRNIPNSLEVDISMLENFDSQILTKDIKLPKDVTLKEDSEEVVAAVSRPQEEEEPEETSEDVDFSSIEVEKKGKEEEEGGDDSQTNSDNSEEK
jgi:large subunit ribosomal protein L25